MTITLKPDTERLINEELKRGHYKDAEEVIQRALQTLRAAQQIASNEGVDALFEPDVDEIYPPDFQTVVDLPQLSCVLEGALRPVPCCRQAWDRPPAASGSIRRSAPASGSTPGCARTRRTAPSAA